MEGAFRRSLPPDFRLIETFRWEPGAGFLRLGAHLARLEATAARFGVTVDRGALRAVLGRPDGAVPLRVRLTLDLEGRAEAAMTEARPDPQVWTIRVAEERLEPGDPWLGVKTSERAIYDRARAALPEGVDEAVFLNTRGEICEGAITSVFVRRGERLLTPPLACGLLPGVLRAELLAEGTAVEAVLGIEDLREGPVWVGNSFRGLRRARLAAGS